MLLNHSSLIIFASLLLGIASSTRGEVPDYRAWGDETLAAIHRDFWLPKSELYAERLDVASPSKLRQPAYMWSTGVQLTALSAAARLDPETYQSALNSYISAIEPYWHEHQGIGGYDVQPNSAKSDRYYDDNAWIVLALVEAYEVTGEPRFLKRAEETFAFVMSGEDDRLGGGIYWRENAKRSKNTCSNAPTIVAALRLYEQTDREELLSTAKRLYQWTQSNLQDESTGIYYDNLRMNGRLDRRKYSYNSALMIRANCLFYELESDDKYLSEALRIAKSAEQKWIDTSTGAMDASGKFAHMLLEALLAVDRVDHDPRRLERIQKCARYVHDELQDSAGRYARQWDRPPKSPYETVELIDQASVARAFYVVAAASERNHSKTSNTP